jgi:hypothetical protein
MVGGGARGNPGGPNGATGFSRAAAGSRETRPQRADAPDAFQFRKDRGGTLYLGRRARGSLLKVNAIDSACFSLASI